MDVNLHERHFPVGPDQLAPLIDSLASDDDPVWPSDRWPPMRLDNGLSLGSKGGHAMIRYSVDEYVPGRRVRFRFSKPRGFVGWHELSLVPAREGCHLRHTLCVELHGLARISWPTVIRPLHDALIEDALDRAATWLGVGGPRSRWSWRVRSLRRVLRARG